MCIASDPYIAELRAMERYIETQLAWLDTLFATPDSETLPNVRTPADAGRGDFSTAQGVQVK